MATILQSLTCNNPILALLGITPHRIVPENEQFRPSPFVVTMFQIDALLKGGVEAGVFSGDEAGELRSQAVAAGLPINLRAFLNRALEQQVEGELDELSFRMCTAESCTILPGLGHGEIFIGDEQITDPIDSIHGVFKAVEELVGEEDPILTPQQGVLLMRQARELGLPLDEVEQDERYKALPEDVHQRYEQSRGADQQKQIDELLGMIFGGPVMVIEMRIERQPAEPPNFFERLFGRRGKPN